MQLAGCSTLITGASRGLGRALAFSLAARGAHLTLAARGAEDLEAVARAIRARGGVAHAIAADIAQPGSATSLLGQAAALHGPVELLINNASRLGPTPMPTLLDLEPAELEALLATNVVGPFRLLRAAAGPMSLRGRGVILSISSDAAVAHYPGWGGYGASKAAFDHLGATLAAEVPELVHLSIDPGEMNTAMHAAALPDADPASLRDPAAVAAWLTGLLEGPLPASGSRLEAGLATPLFEEHALRQEGSLR